MEETSVIARTPRTCINIWAVITDKPPRGLKIRLNVDYSGKSFFKGHWPWDVEPNMLNRMRCAGQSIGTLMGHVTPARISWNKQMMTRLIQSTLLQWCEIFDNEETWLTTSVCVTCFAVLWLALKGEGVSSMVATTLDAAAGLAQRQRWRLILLMVKTTADGWKYGRYISTEATVQGGFLPVFWDVPKSTIAVSDIGALVECLQANIEFGYDSANNLVVLHNQNRMVDDFGLSAWVTQSKWQVISRSVTAFMVVVRGICSSKQLPSLVPAIAQKHHKVRRLHLVIVDLWRPWKINQTQVRSLTGAHRRLQFCWLHCGAVTQAGKDSALMALTFLVLSAVAQRTPTGSFCLLESQTQRYVDVEHAGFLHPLGLRHFYDGFSLRAEVSIRFPALEAFQLGGDFPWFCVVTCSCCG